MPKLTMLSPSPAIAIAVLALVAAVAGTAIADPLAITSKLTKSKVKKIADKRIDKKADDLSVANADAVGGLTAAQLETPSGFAQRGSDLPLTVQDQTVVATDLTTLAAKRVLAVGSVYAVQTTPTDDAAIRCRLRIGGVTSEPYFQSIHRDLEQLSLTLTFGRELGAGTHEAAVRCRNLPGAFTVVSAGISAWAVGS